MKTNSTKQYKIKDWFLNQNVQLALIATFLLLIAAFGSKAQTINPIKYFTFNGSNALADSMGGASMNFATYGGTYSIQQSGRVGNYLTLDNNSGLGNGGAVNLTNALSIEFLLKPGANFRSTVIMQRDDYAFAVRMEYAKFTFVTTHKNSSGGTVEDNFTIDLDGIGRKSYGYYTDNNWHHIVLVFNAATGLKQIWVDGQLPAGFSKTITPGTFNTGGSGNLYLNHTVSYVKYFGSIDELAIYNTAIPASLIYKHYLGVQAGQPYSFVDNYLSPVPAADPISGPVEVTEFAPGHPSVNVTAIEQMNQFPTPRFKPGNTLIKNFNWMDPKFMGGLFQTGITHQMAADNGTALQVEMAKNFNYFFHVSLGNDVFANSAVNAANANPDFKLSITLLRIQLNNNNCEILNQSKTNAHYLQNSSGQFLDIYGNVTSNKIWRPTAPISSYTNDGNNTLALFNDLFTRLNRNIDMVNENGELFPHISDAALSKDPDVTAAKNASGLSWQAYLAKKYAENETQSYRNIFMSHPRLANAKFTEYAIDGANYYRMYYDEARKINSPMNGQYYATPDFYPRWPNNWRNWVSSWHGWQWIVEARKVELASGDRLYSPFVAAGWDTDEEKNIRPAQWLGLLKCLGMTGAEFYYTGFFSTQAPWPDSKNWIWQAAMPSYAQAVTSRYEDFLRNGELMNGDVPNSYVSPTGPGYSFEAGDLRKLVVARKHNTSNKYAITGTIQPNSNMIGNTEDESTAKITLDGQQLLFKVRKQGSTYVYDKSNPAAPVFYQLDKWHENTHPYRWTRDFYIDAELFDNVNTQVTIKTSVPSGTPAGDFTNFTSYISWPDNTPNPVAVEYQFTPRSSGGSNYYFWVRARSRDGVTTSMNVQLNNNPAKTIGCVSDTNWTWYRYDACTQLAVNMTNMTYQNQILRITPSNGKLEIDQILLTTNSNLILNSAPPSCSAATATISANGNTTFCQGGTVTLTASSGTSYLWSPGGQTTQSITASTSGTYNVTVGSGAGCAAIANPVTVTVVQNPTATITAGGSTTLCPGGSVSLTASSGSAYLWSPGGQTTQTINASTAGSYTVVVTNSSGCSKTSSPVAVTIGQAPVATVSAGGSTSFCQGGTVSLTATAASSYLWYPDGQTTQTINVNSSGNYSVRVTNASGCTALSSGTTVNVYSLPVATINAGGPTTFCQGGNVSLTASAGSSYLWSPGGQTSQNLNVTNSGNYSVRVTNSNGCSATSAAMNVTVNSTPVATITPDGPTTILAGQSVNLVASGGTSYQWLPGGETTSSINVSASGNYAVTAFDASGCSGTSSTVTVTVNTIATPPAVITTSGGNSICPGQNITLTASAGGFYLWSPGGQTTQSIVVSTPGMYRVTVTDSLGMNASDADITIILNPVPAPPSIMTSYIPNSAYQLTAYEPTAHQYLWQHGPNTPSTIVNSPGTYNVTAFNSFGCQSAPKSMVVNSTSPQSCVAPDMLSTYNITNTEATLSWNPAITAQSFIVEYTRILDNTVKTVTVQGNVSSVRISELEEGEDYKWTVSAECGGILFGSSDIQFTTLSGPLPCGSTPQDLSTDMVNSTIARVSWMETQGDFVVLRYREIGTIDYQHKRMVAASATTKLLMGLTPSTTYEWSIRSICGTGVSNFSPSHYFTTLPVCPSIGAVAVQELDHNSVRLIWNASVQVDTISIRYALTGTTNYTVIKIAGNPNPGLFTIPGLQSETTYDAWVITKCSSGSTSTWGQGVTFTTLPEPVTRFAPESGLIHLNAYPNPTKNQIGYVFDSKDDKSYMVSVCDMAGRELFAETRIANEGKTDEKISLAGFSSVMYMLIVQKGPMVGRFKFNISE